MLITADDRLTHTTLSRMFSLQCKFEKNALQLVFLNDKEISEFF